MRKITGAFIWLIAFPVMLTFSFGLEVIALCWVEAKGKAKAVLS